MRDAPSPARLLSSQFNVIAAASPKHAHRSPYSRRCDVLSPVSVPQAASPLPLISEQHPPADFVLSPRLTVLFEFSFARLCTGRYHVSPSCSCRAPAISLVDADLVTKRSGLASFGGHADMGFRFECALWRVVRLAAPSESWSRASGRLRKAAGTSWFAGCCRRVLNNEKEFICRDMPGEMRGPVLAPASHRPNRAVRRKRFRRNIAALRVPRPPTVYPVIFEFLHQHLVWLNARIASASACPFG